MKEFALYLSRVNLHSKLKVCLIIRNHVNGGEQEVKTLILGPEALQATWDHTERLETVE